MNSATAKPLRDNYWAAAPKEEIAAEINQKFDDHLQYLQDTGHARKIQVSYDQYYGEKVGGYEVELVDGTISKTTVNHYKNLLSRIHSMTVQAKLAFAPKARNSDSRSLLECDLGKGLLQYEIEDGEVGSRASILVEAAVVLFGGYIYAPWNKLRGTTKRPDANGRMIKGGQQEYYNLNVFEVARSHALDDSPYDIVEIKQNRFDLVAEYPDHAEHIRKASMAYNDKQLVSPYSNAEKLASDDDIVKVRVLIHKKTTSLASGRVTMILGTEVLSDEAYEYPHHPVIELKAGNRLQDQVADAPGSSLIGLQQILDRVYSANVTNVINNCVSNIYSTDPNLKISQIRKGQNLITASAEPKALALTGVSPDAVNLNNDIVNQLTLISGVNNTARGNPEASLKSGTSLSLILSTAIQYIAPLQEKYAQAMADLGTVIIGNLQRFCDEQKIAFVAGASGKAAAREFSAKDLENIERVSVELGNPITQNFSGRMEIVQLLMQYGIVKDPRKLDDFLRTGNWESLTEDGWNESILIREENEMLRRGQQPKVIISDNHPQHIIECLKVLYSQDTRQDPVVVKAVLDHAFEHITQMKQMDPDLAAILGIQPLPSMMQPPPGPPPGGQPPMPGQKQGGPEVMGANMPSGANIPPGFQEGYQQFAEQTGANPAAQTPEAA